MESEGLSEIAKNIIIQAPNWNFSGDCLILQWMEQISQNLEAQAQKTTESLDKLTKNIGCAQISLENTQNSLNALQYTQYVEMRCQDDEVYIEPEKVKDELEEKPKKEILKVFLQNNLNMLQNCHDRFSFLDDSDEDEMDNIASGENCIYQPRNPYNERLLPHIYGTKMWKENWHVGLCEEGMQNYSGDEQSDVYSLSSSSSVDNKSMESHNTENLSHWTSSVSLDHENSNLTNKMGNYVPPAYTSMAPSTILDLTFPEVARIPETIQSNFNDKTVHSKENKSKTATSITNENLESSVLTGATKKKPIQSKTLNLFDDNDFKSLMSEISEKAQTKQNIMATRTERAPAEKPKVDLFDSRSNSPIAENNVTKTPSFSQANETFKQKSVTVNLFDSPTDEFPPTDRSKQSTTNSKVDLFADLDNNDNNKSIFLTGSPNETPSKIEKKTMISSKSLFDDDEDGDDDFLNIFAKSKLNSSGTSTQIAKSEAKSFKTKRSSTLLFDDDDVDENDFVFSKTDSQATQDKFENVPKQSVPVTVMENTKTVQKKTKNIFMDDSDDGESDSIFSEPKRNILKENITQEEVNIVKPTNLHSKQKDLPVFDNDDRIFNEIPTTSPKPSKPMSAFMALEPPEDFEEQHEKHSSTTIKQKYINDVEDDEDFLNLFSSNKSKLKTKDITGAGDFDSLSQPAKKPLTSEVPEDTFTSNNKPADITGTTSSSVMSTNIPENEKTSVTKAKLAVEVTSTSKNGNLLSSEEAKSIVSLNSEQQGIAKSFESTKSSEQKAELLAEEAAHIEPAIKATKAADFNPTDGKQHKKSDVPSTRLHEEASHSSTEPKITIETSKDVPHTPKLNIPIQPCKPPTYDSYSPLFLDEPPDDDDFFQTISASVNVPQSNFENDFYETTQNIIKTSNETKPEDLTAQKPVKYNIGLFSEIPPDDEEGSDDFLEPTFKNTGNIQTASIFEPSKLPTDIFENVHAKGIDDQVDQTINKPKGATNKLAPPKDVQQDIPPKTTVTVSKLKLPNININVQALLPTGGAKPKTRSKESVTDNVVPTIEPPQPNQNISIPKEQRLEAGRENILPSLCKNRVRGPLKRRASSRAGRQESYRQTLENDRKEQNEQSTESAKNENPLTVDHAGHDNKSLSNVKNIESKILNTSSTLPNLPASTTYQYQPPPNTQMSTRSNLFDDFDDNENNDDFFSNLIKPNTSTGIEQKGARNTSITPVAQDSDDDLFKSSGAIQPTATKKKTHEISKAKATPSSLAKKEPAPKKSNALFGSDSNDDEDDDLFRTISKPKVSANVLKEAKGNSKGLFSDSEDDDDDLFRSTLAKTKEADSTKSVAASVKKTTLNTQPLTAKTKTSAPTKTDNPLADLFDS